jgi:hypothetical protein
LQTSGSPIQASDADQRARWLAVIGYEVWMLVEACKMLPVVQASFRNARAIQNAVTESWVLHTRNLCEFCCMPRRYSTDIKPEDLFDDYCSNTRYGTLRKLVENVQRAYTEKVEIVLPNGNMESCTPQWAFNKMLAHPTQNRGLGFEYVPFLDRVIPKIKLLADEIGRLEKKQGRDFPPLP